MSGNNGYRIRVMTYKGYTGSIEYSELDKCFHGKIEGIDGLISYEGQTLEELELDFRESVHDYLWLCNEVGRVPEVGGVNG